MNGNYAYPGRCCLYVSYHIKFTTSVRDSSVVSSHCIMKAPLGLVNPMRSHNQKTTGLIKWPVLESIIL